MRSTKRRSRPAVIIGGLLLCIVLLVFRDQVRIFIKTAASAVRRQFVPARTVEDRVREFGEVVAKRLEPDFRRANIPYPPRSLTLIGLKEEKVLEVYAAGEDGEFRFIRSYPILAASGRLGPKLREGDLQVPEGIYRLESLNPNSLYHLSLRVNYPNEFDRSMAATEDRENLGGDIMIHGSEASIGCLAMGDPGAEDLFICGVLPGQTRCCRVRLCGGPVSHRRGGEWLYFHVSVRTAWTFGV